MAAKEIIRLATVIAAGSSLLWLASTACSPDLGAAPFKCSAAGQCPDGYECNPAQICVKQGTCPAGLPGCGTGGDTCGDGKCTGGETCETCEEDCGACSGDHCGDGECSGDETCASCEKDCGPCSETCGDGTCDPGETCETCEADCGPCSETCGDGTCDPGETCKTCEADCGPCSTCGDGTCDPGETTVNCPLDCPPQPACQEDETKCQDASSLTYCEDGAWQTDTCEHLCQSGGFDYAVGCRAAPDSGKDTCLCGNHVGFGGICTDELLCAPDLFCGSFGATAAAGFCTKYCTNPGGYCSGAPYGTEAECILPIGSQHACGFTCGFYVSCPTGMTCDSYDDVCKP